ncbi:hypothetical protein [Streptomyces sp. SID161]|uniref:hypothetical protein n=1 Tax=Streptomyces sp. SID161 TaxID=2690251 RepID=UPI00136D8A1F|nr:hypothetical protein [Streptomyces sp. SID161]MYW48854.1 hypothetical protein [Streptomyces sp. SID161]MYW49861.1 hypothetical protein [Streptomyces sp. SID161]
MAVLLRLAGGTEDLGEIVEALLTAADAKSTDAPALADRWRDLAHGIGDSLDALPKPTPEN